MGIAASNSGGTWSSTIQFPLIPVAVATIPQHDQLLTWAAFANDTYGTNVRNVTQTALYNPVNGSVQEFPVAYTNHDMFCPSTSYDFNGRLIVAGGDTSSRTSIFLSENLTWTPGLDMVKGRGYQSSATLSNGKIFTIGGSWSGGIGDKNGEIYNGSSWTYLPGCEVAPMLTNDSGGVFRADNHAWLFGWKNGTAFQGGPSKAMHWYHMEGNGSWTNAGLRGSDNDAMCGSVAMYDAVAGKILAVGGSPSYQNATASSNANIITILAPDSAAQTQQINNMSFARIFHTATILPDGQVFIVGGQTFGHPFYDDNSILVPELWNPATKAFTQMAKGPTPRNYHSTAALLSDATVFSGGGGLCGAGCAGNHFDGQIFSPPYLYKSGSTTLAQRPVISSVSNQTVKVGGQLQVTVALVNAALDAVNNAVTFSAVRYGASTHTVNTDQRRVPLSPISHNNSVYTFQLPNDPGVLIPGYWYLFVLENGVPSHAETLKIQP